METAKVFAKDIRVGDRIMSDTQVLVVDFVGLLRGIDIEIMYHHAALHMRGIPQQRMVTSKNTIFTIQV